VQARALADSATGSRRAQLDSLAPAPTSSPLSGRRGGQGVRPRARAPTLQSASNAALAAAMALQDADVTPTAAQVAACARARTQVNAVMARWHRLRVARRA